MRQNRERERIKNQEDIFERGTEVDRWSFKRVGDKTGRRKLGFRRENGLLCLCICLGEKACNP